ncbi:MAG TPA: DnaJ family domain-containing protein [Pyrinomonadaceae bacterium]|jgi:DnaJ family protein C protein 28|nr:DnaJ family domain-containing protein [Pyrinomonadaceae bacterium]
MGNWDKLVEQKIKEAMERGEFKDLAGKGRPINLDENPFEDPTMRTAYRLLKNNNFTLPWIEERKELDAAVEGARADLARSWRVYQESYRTRRAAEQGESDWNKVLGAFRRQVSDLNRRIAAYNLKAPSTTFHKLPLDADREINRLIAGK